MNEQKQWRGPEDGLPPVGTVCEVRYLGKYNNNWLRIKITAVTDTFVIGYIREDWESCINKSDPYVCFRPLRTEEDKAVEDMRDIIVETYRNSSGSEPSELPHSDSLDVYLRKIYRAGYRKQESD